MRTAETLGLEMLRHHAGVVTLLKEGKIYMVVLSWSDILCAVELYDDCLTRDTCCL